jgi:hypothetical protein
LNGGLKTSDNDTKTQAIALPHSLGFAKKKRSKTQAQGIVFSGDENGHRKNRLVFFYRMKMPRPIASANPKNNTISKHHDATLEEGCRPNSEHIPPLHCAQVGDTAFAQRRTTFMH